jgi:hypothetical protein
MSSPAERDAIYPPLQAALRADDVEELWRLAHYELHEVWCLLAGLDSGYALYPWRWLPHGAQVDLHLALNHIREFVKGVRGQ